MTGKAKGFGEFTPAFDSKVEKYGMIAALVFGRVWRRCQSIDVLCYESNSNMAKGLKCSRRTVIRAVKKLVKAGELFRVERIGKTSLLSYMPTCDRESRVKMMTPDRES